MLAGWKFWISAILLGLASKTFPSVVGWVFVKGPLCEEMLFRYLHTLAPPLLYGDEEAKPHQCIQNVGPLHMYVQASADCM